MWDFRPDSDIGKYDCSFFSKAWDARDIFRKLKIGRTTYYEQYIHRFPLIHISFNESGRILAVGISCDRETKHHSCKVEVLKNFPGQYNKRHPFLDTGKTV